jgi:hypothetical protein
VAAQGGDGEVVIPPDDAMTDDELMSEIRRLNERADPVPEAVVDAARRAFSHRTPGDASGAADEPAGGEGDSPRG